MARNVERAAEVIYRALSGKYGDFNHHDLVSQALAEAGLLMPDLPEPAYEGSTTWYVPGKNEWSTDTYKGQVLLEVDVEEAGDFGPSTITKMWVMDQDEARALIGALLAATNHAEQEQESG